MNLGIQTSKQKLFYEKVGPLPSLAAAATPALIAEPQETAVMNVMTPAMAAVRVEAKSMAESESKIPIGVSAAAEVQTPVKTTYPEPVGESGL